MTKPTNRKRAKKRLLIRKTKQMTQAGALTAWRTLLLLVMGGLLLFCAAWVWLLYAFNAQHISEVITQQLEQKLDRPVMISSLELKFLNTLELKGFYVLDTTGDAGQAFVSADSVTLAFELLPLLEHKLVIHEVTLNEPRFNLVRREDGTYNTPQIASSKSSNITNLAGRKFQTSIRDWSIKNGTIRFNDLASGANHSLFGLNAHFTDLNFDNFSPFSTDMVLRNEWQEKISEIEIQAQGQINFADFNWKGFALRDLNAQVHLFKTPIEIALDLNNLMQPNFKLSVSAPSFTAADIPFFELDKLSFQIPPSVINVQGKLENDYKQLELSQISLQAGDIIAAGSAQVDFSQSPFALQANFATQPFAFAGKEKIWSALAKYKLTGQGSIKGELARTNGKYTLPLLTVQAQGASGNFYGFKTSGVTGEFEAKNHFADIYARTKTGTVKVDRSTFDKLDLSGTWRNGNLYAYIASSRLNEVPLKLRLNVDDLKKGNRRIRANLHFGTFDPMAFIETVKDFVTVITPLTGNKESTPEVTGELAWLRNFRDRLPEFMPNFAGTLTADTFSSTVLSGTNFNAEFDLTGLRAGAKELSGPIELQLKDGIIHQMEKLAAEQEALNVTFQPFIMMHRMERAGSFSVGKVLRDVEVQELAASVNFTNGAMQINNAYTVGPTISASVSGMTDWVQELFDLTIYTMFTNTSKSGVLAENLTDESGNPALAFRVSGAMTKPKLEMLRAKKAGKTIQGAQTKGVNTDFSQATQFIQGDFHAKK